MLEFIFSFLHFIESSSLGLVKDFMAAYGGFGIALGMFLESSIVPIPSEVILIAAGALGFDPLTVAIWGAIGSTIGSIVGYHIGLWGGRPVVNRFGKYLFITPKRVEGAENTFKKYGGWTILGARLIPLVPFKVFSITSGLLKFDLKKFVLFTFIGTIPRAFLLAWVGEKIMAFSGAIYLLIALIVVAVVALYLYRRFEKRKAVG